MTDEVLLLENNQDARELCEQLLEMKADVEVEAREQIPEQADGYDTVITDYAGFDVDQIHDRFDADLIVHTGYPEDQVELPKDAEYFAKGKSYDKLVDTITFRPAEQ